MPEKIPNNLENNLSQNKERKDVGIDYYRSKIEEREGLISDYSKLLRDAFIGEQKTDIPQASFSALATEKAENPKKQQKQASEE